jgi:hypothetical protein
VNSPSLAQSLNETLAENDSPSAAANALAATLQSLADLVEQDGQGRPKLTFTLPDATALDGLTKRSRAPAESNSVGIW